MNKNQLTYTAGALDQDAFLREILSDKLHLSHSLVVRLKQELKIKVNGSTARTNYRLKAGDLITVDMDFSEENGIIPEAVPLDIVCEDEDFLAVHKPAAMSIHPSRPGGIGTLANAVTYYWQRMGRKTLFRPINRLDRDTSGLVLIAKSQFAHQAIFKQQQNRKIEKRYMALVEGRMEKNEDLIDLPILRPDAAKRRRIVDPGGQKALTHYRVLEEYPDHTLLELKPETGRTHQIRVHLSFLGHPICGDLLYGYASTLIDRQALHAGSLRFIHPRSGGEVFLDAPLPEDMRKAIEKAKSFVTV